MPRIHPVDAIRAVRTLADGALRPGTVAVAQVFTPAAILAFARLLLLVGAALAVRWHVRPPG